MRRGLGSHAHAPPHTLPQTWFGGTGGKSYADNKGLRIHAAPPPLTEPSASKGLALVRALSRLSLASTPQPRLESRRGRALEATRVAAAAALLLARDDGTLTPPR